MSVWTDIDALGDFVYRNPAHLSIMRRRREWLEPMQVYQALWWVRAGTVPGVAEALAKLALLAARGPSPHAFTFRQPFPAPHGMPAAPILDECA
jgi:hypothetical protein